jgi:hypothetical protein
MITAAFWIAGELHEPAGLLVHLILQPSTVERPPDATMVVKPSWIKVS